MSTRKDFLAGGAALAALPVVADAATNTASSKPRPAPSEAPLPPLNFDLTTFDTTLNRAVAHRHLFAAKLLDGASVFTAIRATLRAYHEIGVPYGQVAPVAVLYHDATVLGLNDAMWDRYVLPIARKKTKKSSPMAEDLLTVIDSKTNGNPSLAKQTGSWDSSIPSLIADANAYFFLCNNAMRGIARSIAHETKHEAAVVYEELSKNLIPNAMIIPAGVWGIHAIQERRYTLLQASL